MFESLIESLKHSIYSIEVFFICMGLVMLQVVTDYYAQAELELQKKEKSHEL
jgi:hypothetical protein